jgi:hypothetical protein
VVEHRRPGDIGALVAGLILLNTYYEQFLPARPAFWRLNDDLLSTVWSRLILSLPS